MIEQPRSNTYRESDAFSLARAAAAPLSSFASFFFSVDVLDFVGIVPRRDCGVGSPSKRNYNSLDSSSHLILVQSSSVVEEIEGLDTQT